MNAFAAVAVEYEPAFVQTVDLHLEVCSACRHPLCRTPNAGQQVGSVSAGPNGLAKIALYHWECAPENLRAANRQDEIEEFEDMLPANEVEEPEDEELGEVTSCAYMTWRGSNNPDCPEPPEYCDEDNEPGSEFCKAHEGAGWED